MALTAIVIPDEDLPTDFEVRRTPYYEALNLSLEADRFVLGLQKEMLKALQTLDTGLARNPNVRVSYVSVTDLTMSVKGAQTGSQVTVWSRPNIYSLIASHRSVPFVAPFNPACGPGEALFKPLGQSQYF